MQTIFLFHRHQCIGRLLHTVVDEEATVFTFPDQSCGNHFAEMIVDCFDEMLEQSEGQSLVMGVALHPYIVGQPHRLRPLRAALDHVAARRDRIWLTRAGEISDYCHAELGGVLA